VPAIERISLAVDRGGAFGAVTRSNSGNESWEYAAVDGVLVGDSALRTRRTSHAHAVLERP
jgi:hypothetical protein